MSSRFVKLFFIVLFVPTLFFVSCTNRDYYNKNIDIPEKGWYKNEAAKFDVTVNDTLQNYNFYLYVRNNTNYRYSNLYIFLNTIFPNDNKTRDTIEIVLANNSGKWLGKGWGSIKENNVLLRKNLRFPLKGKYSFLIQQAMRCDTLKGITNIGIRLSVAQE